MATSLEIGMSLAEFVRRFDESPFELIEGEVQLLSPNMPRSSRVNGRIFRLLAAHVEAHQQGEVFIETPFVLQREKQWVKGSRVPDTMFVTADRLKALAETDQEWENSPLPLVPDLAVEVMSPTDRLAAAKRKAERYLEDGVRLVWVIDPERQAVFVYGAEGVVTLTDEDTLTGEGVIAGFAVEIHKLFD